MVVEPGVFLLVEKIMLPHIFQTSIFLAASLFLVFTLLPATAIAHDLNGKLRVDGRKRAYIVHVPKKYDAQKPAPLVILLHGAFASPNISRWDSRMSEQSEKDGFIVCYPKALRGTWNAGPCCGLSKKIDDVNFIKELISKLQADYKIDASRIYIAGVSNGGMLAYRLGQELSGKVAAIAAVEGCMYQRLDGKEPVSVIAFNGTKDPVIPYDGGTGSWFGIKLKIPGIKDTIKFWTERNACDPQPLTESFGSVVKETYSKGAGGTEVCLYTLKGVGHVWPGGRRAHLTGKGAEKEISATELISKFFLAHPKRELDPPSS